MVQIVKRGWGLFFYLLLITDLFAQIRTIQNQSASTPPPIRITHLRRFDQNVPLAPFAQNLTVRHYDNYKEALHNSLKHSAAKEVVLEAQTQGKRLLMRLKDDGKGFDKDQQSCRNGLENMKRRAETIGGKLEVHSTTGAGTFIEFNGKIS